MALRIITWLISLVFHGAFALAMLLPASSHVALHQGSGDDIMVVEQGFALEGVVKLGEDMASVEAVQAPPVMSAAAQPLEQMEAVEEQEELPVEDIPEVEPVEDQVIASEAGPEAELIEPVQEEMKEPEPEVKEQPLPPQMASVTQQTVVAMRESSGEEKKGGDTTSRREYQGALWNQIQLTKVITRTTQTAKVVVKFTVKVDGSLLDYRIVESSGSKVHEDAALASVARATFPPIPPEWGVETHEEVVPFEFKVKKR